MGQKVNPHGLRVGVIKDWDSRWYAKNELQFASLEGKNAGEFYTPSCIVRTLVEIIQPFHGLSLIHI